MNEAQKVGSSFIWTLLISVAGLNYDLVICKPRNRSSLWPLTIKLDPGLGIPIMHPPVSPLQVYLI
jgi:hypothetical protein